MGHLGNPVGFRLGFQKNWKHNWFVKNLYYPELLNDMLNIRDYLYYYMTRSVMLKSGFCLSHFYMYKWRKNYYIKVYIYQIDLEKLSYDYINQAFFNYYEVYNKAVKRRWNKRNKSIVNYFRDLTNSDLYVFYFVFFSFISKNYNKKKINNNKYNKLLHNNLYLQNLDVKDYSYMLLLDYVNIILLKIQNKNILDAEGHLIHFYKQLKKEKMKKQLDFKKIIFIASQILKKKKKKDWTSDDLIILEYCLKKIYYKKKKKIFFFFFLRMQKNLKKAFRRLAKLRNIKSDPFFFNKINKFINFNNNKKYCLEHNSANKNKVRYKVKFIDFFFYLAKKVGFQKFNNSFTLNRKWNKLLKYLKVFNQIGFYKEKFNIKSFFYMISLFIYANLKARAVRRRFKFKQSIYISLYVSIAKEFFTCTLKLVTLYMKHLITILCSKIKYNNIFFVYYFMTNQNVTAQLISRYIALKLKKNFTLVRTLNPLKRELCRLSKRTRTAKKAFRYYNYQFLFKKIKRKIKKKIKKYLYHYRKLFKACNYNYYINNWFFISFNTFYYHKNYNKYYNFCLDKCLSKQKLYNIKYLIFLKIFFINTYYQFILNIYKGKKLKFRNSKNILLLNLLKLFNITLLLKYKKVLIGRTKLVYLSSFFYKNLLNFKLVHFIWARFNNFNARNVRQQYIPKYKSILMGYKMAFRGRFSRKQRASFIWTQVGKAPLNTISINIEYSFFTIPLKNSIISIKIWLYKLKNFIKFKYHLKV